MQETAFVARENEMAQLQSFLKRVLAGQGQMCFVAGQAGAGKSALLHHFVAQAIRENAELVAALGECNAQTGLGDPYLPFREALAQLTAGRAGQDGRGEPLTENSRRLRRTVTQSVRILVDVAPDLVGLLIPGGKILGELGKAIAKNVGLLDDLERLMQRQGRAGAIGLAEQARLFEQFTAFLQALSRSRPLVLILDDLQWADAASISLLFYLSRRIADHRILIVGAYRPDDVAVGRNDGRHPLEAALHEFKRYFGDAVIDLDQATAERGRAFVDALLDRPVYAVSDEFRRALYRLTNGHALFTVEILRSLEETGALVRDEHGRCVEGAGLDWSVLPARVEGVIEERIARLDNAERDMLRVASVEGEQFRAEVVAALRQAGSREVVRTLSDHIERQHHLVRAEGVRQVGERRLSTYRFVHNMVQRYLYNSLGEAERAYLHEDIGQLLEKWFADGVDEIAVQLAHHFEQAGDTFRSARYLLLAGERARRMSANEEAFTHLTRGLQLVQVFPEDSLERAAFEMGLQVALGATLIALRGYGAAEVGRAFGRAREMCRAMQDPPGVMPVLYGLCLYFLATGNIAAAQEEGDRLLSLAEQAGDRAYQLGGHALLAATTAYQGLLLPARRHCEQALVLYQPDTDRDMGFKQGQDPAVVALSYLAWVLWLLGYPDESAVREAQALALAQRIGHPFSQALALAFSAMFRHFRSDWPTVQARSEELIALARSEQFPFWEAMAVQMLGTSLARRGRSRAGMALLEQGMAAWAKAGTRLGVPMFTLSLAEVCFQAGDDERARALVDRSVQEARETGQLWWYAEQHRLHGRILAGAGDTRAAAACFREALSIARSQRARILELRAALCLARMPLPPAEQEQARQDLAALCAVIRSERGCPELSEAQALLASGPGAAG